MSNAESMKSSRPSVPKSVAWLVIFFVLKDFFAFGYASTREFGYKNEFILRVLLLPGSAIFWGFVGWLAPIFNILAGAFLGWVLALRFGRPK